MQTFLPYKSYVRSAECLDLRRLGKQIMEARQILKALHDPNYGWQNHPAVKMWRGYEQQLYYYAACMANEWNHRRGKDHGAWINTVEDAKGYNFTGVDTVRPPWVTKEFCRAHRSNLYRKDPVHYSQFAKYGPDLPYVWPI